MSAGELACTHGVCQPSLLILVVPVCDTSWHIWASQACASHLWFHWLTQKGRLMQNQRSQHQNKARAMQLLAARLEDAERCVPSRNFFP